MLRPSFLEVSATVYVISYRASVAGGAQEGLDRGQNLDRPIVLKETTGYRFCSVR